LESEKVRTGSGYSGKAVAYASFDETSSASSLTTSTLCQVSRTNLAPPDGVFKVHGVIRTAPYLLHPRRQRVLALESTIRQNVNNDFVVIDKNVVWFKHV